MIHKKFKFILITFLFILNDISFAEVKFKSLYDLSSHIKKSGFNGVILVMKGNKTLMSESLGYRDIETKTPIQITDKFQI